MRAVWALSRGSICARCTSVKARGGAGQAPPAPELLWRCGCGRRWRGSAAPGSSPGCAAALVYRWLCGGVSMNYTRCRFSRGAYRSARALAGRRGGGAGRQGLVALDALAQDGLRVRAAAGAGSFRRRARLGDLVRRPGAGGAAARRARSDPAAGDRRQRAAQQRAAREREARVGRRWSACARSSRARASREDQQPRSAGRRSRARRPPMPRRGR